MKTKAEFIAYLSKEELDWIGKGSLSEVLILYRVWGKNLFKCIFVSGAGVGRYQSERNGCVASTGECVDSVLTSALEACFLE